MSTRLLILYITFGLLFFSIIKLPSCNCLGGNYKDAVKMDKLGQTSDHPLHVKHCESIE
jgi:hypothetical protein